MDYETHKRAENRSLAYIDKVISYYTQNKIDLNTLMLLRDLITSHVSLVQTHPTYREARLNTVEHIFEKFEIYTKAKEA